MQHKLWIHIGMPKTGTSSLQKFLAFHNDILKKYGWYYPDSRGNFYNGSMNDSDRYKNDGYWPYVRACLLQEKNWEADLAFFHEKVQDSLNLYHTILSGEDVCLGEDFKYIEYLSQKYSDIVLVVYLRRQDFGMESGYSQYIKGFRNGTKTFQEWVSKKQEDEKNGNRMRFRYYDKLKGLEKIVTNKNMVVRPYVEGKEFDICKDFLDVIGLKEKYEEFHAAEYINRSFSIMDTEVKRRLNVMLRQHPTIEEMLQKEYWKVYETSEQPMCSFRFSIEERKSILERYALQNKNVSEHYRDGKKLFHDQYDFEPVKVNEDEVTLSYIKLLEKLLLRSSYRNVYPSMAFAFSSGREIAVFGAGFLGKRLIEEHHLPADIIIDNKKEMSGKKLGNIKIVMPKEIQEWKKYFVVIAVGEAKEIEKQLESFGLKKKVDFMHMNQILKGEMPCIREF